MATPFSTISESKEGRNLTLDLDDRALMTPHVPALLLSDRTVSYGELNDLIWATCRYLYEHGLRSGDRVALSFTDDLTAILAMLATARLGATVITVPVNTSSYLRARMTDQVNPSLMVKDRSGTGLRGIPSLILEPRLPGRYHAAHDPSLLCEFPTVPMFVFTGSGSTGQPRLIPLNHQQLKDRLHIYGNALSMNSDDRIASLISLDFHMGRHSMLLAFHCGGAWMPPAEQPPDMTALRSPTYLTATVFHVEQLLRTDKGSIPPFMQSLRVMSLGASTVSEDLRSRIRNQLCPNLHVFYGIKEAGRVSILYPHEMGLYPGSVGKPLPGMEVEVVDRKGNPVPAGEAGLVRVRGPGLFDGYLHDDEATREVLRDGWFYPGDAVRLNKAGHLIFLGRADHMMIMNGINIYPAEIEQAITAHPAVADAAAVPLTHPVHQDIPVCAVALHQGASCSEHELLAFGRERLGGRSPRIVTILPRIPRNEQGKLVRNILAEELTKALAPPSEVTGTPTPPSDGPVREQRQLCFTSLLTFSPPDKPDMERLDRWLADIVAIPPGELKAPQETRATRQPTRAREWLWRSLILARFILQAVRVPAFDPPVIINCAPLDSTDETFRAQIALPLVEYYPLELYSHVVNAALQTLAWMAERDPVNGQPAVLWQTLNERVVTPLRKQLLGGKSTLPILAEAYRRNIPFGHLGAGIYQLGWGCQARRIDRSTTERDSPFGYTMAQHKGLTARFLRQAGLPAPEHGVVTDHESMAAMAKQLGWPLVVKPADRDRGEAVTVDVTDEESLKRAYRLARDKSPSGEVLIERQVPGVCHRVFVAFGDMLYCVKRRPMGVAGDGRNTVAQLVAAELRAQERKPPWERSELKPIDDLARVTLAHAGYSEHDVLPEGVLAPLRPFETTEWGGVDEDLSHSIHRENRLLALEATRLFGLEVAGVDIITEDISRPWHETGAIINEVNFGPLLGGGEISRSRVPTFVERLIDGDGRIPLEVFIGGKAAWIKAEKRWRTLRAGGQGWWLTSGDRTLDPRGAEYKMTTTGEYGRLRSLLLKPGTEALVLVLQSDELLGAGSPPERVDQVTVVDHELVSAGNPGERLDPDRRKALLKLFRKHS